MGFEGLKHKQAQMWGMAPFEGMAATLALMHEAVAASVVSMVGAGWLDVGCGTGELSRLVARAGAEVTGVDLAPALVDTARRRAEEEALAITYEVADCEALPYDDGTFDVVTSSVAAIFAPEHAAVATELAHVCAPGGQLVLTAWVNVGHTRDVFEIVSRYAPPPPADVGRSQDWGDEDYCHRLLCDAFHLKVTRLDCPWQGASPEAMVRQLEDHLGIFAAVVSRLETDRADELRREMAESFAKEADGSGVSVHRPYLLVSGRRR